MLLVLSACNNQDGSREQKLDSLNQRIDTTLDKAWDSTKEKAKELKDKVSEEWKELKDSGRNRDTSGN